MELVYELTTLYIKQKQVFILISRVNLSFVKASMVLVSNRPL